MVATETGEHYILRGKGKNIPDEGDWGKNSQKRKWEKHEEGGEEWAYKLWVSSVFGNGECMRNRIQSSEK